MSQERADRGSRALVAVIAAGAGVVTGAGGTLVHRWESADLPAGMALALLGAAVGAVFARSVADGVGVFLFGLAGLITAQVMTFVGPGGDVLVTGGALSYVWLLGLPLTAAAVAVLTPRTWYADRPASGSRHAVGE